MATEQAQFDPNAAWRQLSPEAQSRIGAATIAFVAGVAGEDEGREPRSAFLAARVKSLGLMEELVRGGLTEAFDEDDQPFVPALAAIGIKTVTSR